MRIGLRLPLDPDVTALAHLGREAERAGVESVWVSDHLAWPERIESAYPYHPEGEPPPLPDIAFHDPFVLLAAIASVTTELRLALGVYVAPLRSALATARALATLEALSAGRCIFGVGLGWMREEFDAAGMPFDRRGERTEDVVGALRALYQPSDLVSYEGRLTSIPPMRFEPKPRRGADVPIHMGGVSPAALRRAVRLADGWLGMNHEPDEAAGLVAQLERLCTEAGRPRLEVSVQAPLPCDPSMGQRYVQAGVDRLVLVPWGPGVGLEEGLAMLRPWVQEYG